MSNGKTDILVKVENKEDDYFYEWPADKFHSRLYMIREILEEFFDSGELPTTDKNEDPFWDPPNPVLIGQSFLQLEPLGLQFENNLNAVILSIDGKGGKSGELSIGYKPANEDGDTTEENLPEHLMVDEVMELVGKKNMYFVVEVKGASCLPDLNCTNPFVTYQFKFEQENTY